MPVTAIEAAQHRKIPMRSVPLKDLDRLTRLMHLGTILVGGRNRAEKVPKGVFGSWAVVKPAVSLPKMKVSQRVVRIDLQNAAILCNRLWKHPQLQIGVR